MGDPASLPNSNSAALRYALLDNRYGDIFVRVIVVYDQDRLGDEYVTFDVDEVLGGNNAVGAYVAIVLNHNRGIPFGVVVGDVEPRAFS